MKLSDATQEQKIRALAELDEWEPKYLSQETNGICPPQYLTSYDAIIPLVQKVCISPREKVNFIVALRNVMYNNEPPIQTHEMDFCETFEVILDATCQQLSDTLLIATGKFEL